jgi:hypothetical protein
MKSERPMTPSRQSVQRLFDIVSEETSLAEPGASVPATLARIRARAIEERLIGPNDPASQTELFTDQMYGARVRWHS